MSATIKDVAKAAGVSVGTVSKVINNSGYVSDKMKQRILLAISLLDYQPNAIARSLKTSKTNTIGVILTDITSNYIMNIAKAVDDVALAKGYNLLLCHTNHNEERELINLQLLMERRVDGIVMIPTGGNVDMLSSVSNSVPIVLLERGVDEFDCDRVAHDYSQISYSIIYNLHKLGHDRIAICHGDERNWQVRESVNGCKRAFEELKVTAKKNYWSSGESITEGRRMAARLLGLRKPPTTIYCTNELLTVGIIRELRDRAIRIPEDIELVTLGNFDPYNLIESGIRVIEKDPTGIGNMAIRRLFDRINETSTGIKPKDLLHLPENILANLRMRGIR